MRKVVAILSLCSTLLAGTICSAHAQVGGGGRTTRVDLGVFHYDFSSGGERYGPWSGTRLKATNQPTPGRLGFTGILELTAERRRDDGNDVEGAFVVGSAYYDWSDRVYSFSSVGASSGEPFVQFSAHQEIDVKLLPERNVVLNVGGGYLDYHTVNRNTYVTAGGAYYWQGVFDSDPDVVLQYQYRRYFADPVDAQLDTHILSLGFMWNPGRRTTARYLNGQESFRAGGGATPVFDAALRGQVITLDHEEHLTERYGVTVGLGFMNKRHDQEDRSLFRGTGLELGFFWNL